MTGPSEWFPRSLLNRSTGSAPNYAPAISPRLRRRHSSWPPDRRHQPAKSCPPRQRRAGARCGPAQIRQVRAGGFLLRGVQPLVHSRYTFPSCLPDPDHLAVLARPVVVRAASTLTPVPEIRLPSASPARCDEPTAVSFHHRTVQERLVALDAAMKSYAVGQPGRKWRCTRSGTRSTVSVSRGCSRVFTPGS